MVDIDENSAMDPGNLGPFGELERHAVDNCVRRRTSPARMVSTSVAMRSANVSPGVS